MQSAMMRCALFTLLAYSCSGNPEQPPTVALYVPQMTPPKVPQVQISQPSVMGEPQELQQTSGLQVVGEPQETQVAAPMAPFNVAPMSSPEFMAPGSVVPAASLERAQPTQHISSFFGGLALGFAAVGAVLYSTTKKNFDTQAVTMNTGRGRMQPVVMHCQVPCGIFTDDGRIATLEEDAATIRKSVVQIDELHKAGALQDWHQLIRWVNTKEDHATSIMNITAEYFLAQKVKKDELSKDQYHEILALHHQVMVAAMKTKQSSELPAVDTLDAAIAAVKPMYMPEGAK